MLALVGLSNVILRFIVIDSVRSAKLRECHDGLVYPEDGTTNPYEVAFLREYCEFLLAPGHEDFKCRLNTLYREPGTSFRTAYPACHLTCTEKECKMFQSALLPLLEKRDLTFMIEIFVKPLLEEMPERKRDFLKNDFPFIFVRFLEDGKTLCESHRDKVLSVYRERDALEKFLGVLQMLSEDVLYDMIATPHPPASQLQSRTHKAIALRDKIFELN